MKSVLRLLQLLLGLIYRLIVLALFERWIPFPGRPPLARPSQPTAPAKRQHERAGRPQRSVWHPLAPRPEPPFFEPRAGEPAAERVAALESAHLRLRAPPTRVSPRAAAGRSLYALARDRRALATAIILGEAFGRRRNDMK